MAPHPLLLRTSRPPAEPRGSPPALQLQLPPRSRAGCPPVPAPPETPRPGYDSRPGRTPPLWCSLSVLRHRGGQALQEVGVAVEGHRVMAHRSLQWGVEVLISEAE